MTSVGDIFAMSFRRSSELKEKQGEERRIKRKKEEEEEEEEEKVGGGEGECTMAGFIFCCKYLCWLQTETWRNF